MSHRCYLSCIPALLLLGSLTVRGVEIASIPDAAIPAYKTLLVPVTGASASPAALRWEASVGGAALTVRVLTNQPHLELTVRDYGILELQLFPEFAPRTVALISGLAYSGFYDNQIFHRIVTNFVVQGGDPLGTGMGGPAFRFDDEFHPDAIFSGRGQLAMANTGKDSNGSQFFITQGQPRFLDFNHTIFGQLVRGFDVLERLNRVQTTNDRPITNVGIERARLVTNTTSAVLLLRALSANGNSTVTVRAVEAGGAQATATFNAGIATDPYNDPAILGAITHMNVPSNQPINISLTGTDLETNALSFAAALRSAPSGTGGGYTNNVVTLFPPAGYVGSIELLVGAAERGANGRGSSADPFDTQVITIGVGALPVQLMAKGGEAITGVALTNFEVARWSTPEPSPAASRFTVEVNWGDGAVTRPAATTAGGNSFIALETHTYARPGYYPVRVTLSDGVGVYQQDAVIHVVEAALTVQRLAEGQLQITWPIGATNFVLESTAALGSPWQAWPGTPDVSSGRRSIVVSGSTNLFFRLRR